jgi:threonine dehydrogenase-like Zn-dependent dehydrogenase
MKALTYHGPHHVRVENVPDPIIEQPDDIILRVTATAICGSDLHLYRGKIPKVQHGDIFGHEFMEIVECGAEVKNLQKGDRVVIPFVIACGDCFFCRLQQYAACENTNAGQGAALNKSKFPRLRRCLATATSTAACRGAGGIRSRAERQRRAV